MIYEWPRLNFAMSSKYILRYFSQTKESLEQASKQAISK